MKNNLKQLLYKIDQNKDFLSEEYPNTISIVFQIDMLLKYDVQEDIIIQWYENCRHAIKIINELIERNNR